MADEELRRGIREEISRRVRADDLEVPLLPHIAQEVLTLTAHANASAKDFASLIEKDQQLSGRLIKIANSPVYAGRVEVTSIQRSIVTVGMRGLRDLVLSVALGERFFRSKRFGGAMSRVWEHSVAAAHIAREIARHKRLADEDAFLCGLLHDTGKPLLLESMDKIAKRHEDPDVFTPHLVDEVLRDFHEQVGGLVARAWGFSDLLYGAIRYHHEYEAAGEARPMALLVHVANLFAHELGLGSYEEDPEADLLASPALADLQLTSADIRQLIKTLPQTTRALIAEFKF